LRAEATAEKLAINAVMAGAPAAAMPLIYAAVEAMADPDFDLAGPERDHWFGRACRDCQRPNPSPARHSVWCGTVRRR